MFNFHKDHRNLVNVSLLVFVLLSMGVAIMPADGMRNTAPLPGMPEMTPAERRGLAVYVAENCAACHTQQVRNIEMDKTWGARPSVPSDYHYSKERMDVWRQSPSLLGSERTGPDLTNVGQRQPGEAWHLLHLYDPRMVVKGSIMPRYGWLFEETDRPADDAVIVPVPKERLRDTSHVLVAKQEALDLVTYLISLKQTPHAAARLPAHARPPHRCHAHRHRRRPARWRGDLQGHLPGLPPGRCPGPRRRLPPAGRQHHRERCGPRADDLDHPGRLRCPARVQRHAAPGRTAHRCGDRRGGELRARQLRQRRNSGDGG
jgi:cbb3-type cytochrome c oxidase subunit II